MTTKMVKKTKKNNRGMLFVALAVFGVGFVLLREKPEKQVNASNQSPRDLDTDKSKSAKILDRPQNSVLPSNFSELKKLAEDKASVGLNEIGLRVDSRAQAFLHVLIKKKPVCHPGDYEALSKSFGSTGNFLLTLEPMNSNKKIKPIFYPLNVNKMFSKEGFALPVDLQERTVYGIYICGDQTAENRCGQKRAVDFNQILNNQNMENNRNGVFYYQFAVLGGSDNRVYTGPTERIANVQEMNQRDEQKVKDIETALTNANRIMSGVKSYSPQSRRTSSGWSLELLVSAMEASACGKI